jgi:hypothetical protein
MAPAARPRGDRAEQEADEDLGVDEVEGHRLLAARRPADVYFHAEGGEQGDDGQHGGADGEALAERSWSRNCPVAAPMSGHGANLHHQSIV